MVLFLKSLFWSLVVKIESLWCTLFVGYFLSHKFSLVLGKIQSLSLVVPMLNVTYLQIFSNAINMTF